MTPTFTMAPESVSESSGLSESTWYMQCSDAIAGIGCIADAGT